MRGYRTALLRELWTHSKRGFYHDGRFATLADVVKHYDLQFELHLSAQQQSDLLEYLKSLSGGEVETRTPALTIGVLAAGDLHVSVCAHYRR